MTSDLSHIMWYPTFLFTSDLPFMSIFGTLVIIGIKQQLSLVQDGSILTWQFNAATNCFEPVTSLTGHSLAVVSLVVGANRLYSGSMDRSIKVSLL